MFKRVSSLISYVEDGSTETSRLPVMELFCRNTAPYASTLVVLVHFCRCRRRHIMQLTAPCEARSWYELDQSAESMDRLAVERSRSHPTTKHSTSAFVLNNCPRPHLSRTGCRRPMCHWDPKRDCRSRPGLERYAKIKRPQLSQPPLLVAV